MTQEDKSILGEIYFDGRGVATVHTAIDEKMELPLLVWKFESGEEFSAIAPQMLQTLVMNPNHSIREIMAEMMNGLEMTIAKEETKQ